MKFLRNPWVTGALVVVALLVVAHQTIPSRLWRTEAKNEQAPVPSVSVTPPRDPAIAQPTPAKDTNKIESSLDRQDLQSRFSKWVNAPRRDPFELLAALKTEVAPPPSPVAGWKLKAIWKQTGGRAAAINKGVYSEGDKIEGYKLETIEGDQVWFTGPRGRESLGFQKQGISNTPPAGASTNH
jgi:hypothetical protein